MAQLDRLLAPIPGDNPSGIELRHDPDFQRLTDALNQPMPDVDVPTDWGVILSDAKDLAKRGRDLRLLVIISQAEFHTGGFDGLASALDLMATSIKEFWETIHPGLRGLSGQPDSALGRKNSLRQLENAKDGLAGDVLRSTVFSVRGFGDVTGAQLASASMSVADALASAPKGLGAQEKANLQSEHETLMTSVQGAARDLFKQDEDQFSVLRSGLEAALTALENLEAAVTGMLQEKAPFTLPKLTKAFRGMKETLAKAEKDIEAENREARANGTAEDSGKLAETKTSPPPQTPSKLNGSAMPDHLNSRQDVARALDLIVDFYERTEPSSPIPHLARRMQKMVPMNFVELMEEIAPGGLKDFKNAAGLGNDKP